MNFLLIESLQRIHYYYGDEFKVECPVGSGKQLSLWQAAGELSHRLSHIFLRRDGKRPVYGDSATFQDDPHWRDLILFLRIFPRRNRRRVSAPATRPAGPRWSPSSSSRAANKCNRHAAVLTTGNPLA